MTPARPQTIEDIFHVALDCEPGQLSALLDKTCSGDELLRAEVETLLAAHQQAESFIKSPVAGLATKIVENRQANSLIGQTIGHYKISKRIGAGGMGEVYLAFDITVSRSAALKLLPKHLTSDTERLKRFQQEVRAVAGLNHPNILTVYEVGAENSIRYIASELVEGETLRQHLARGCIQVDEAVEIAIQVAGALAAAHSADIVHRDIKPENIMLRPDGYVKVLDFGIAKLGESAFAKATADSAEPMTLAKTNLGSILGTVCYMSPEQARGAPVDKRTDIWSLGAVLYEMAAGRAPFTGDTPAGVMAAILAKEPLPLRDYRAQPQSELQQIVSKALRKNPEERYKSANEILEALKRLRHKLEVAAELERSAARRLWLRWMRSPAGVAITLLAGALALAFPFYWLRNPPKDSLPEKSIAVLPFENLSNDKQNSHFADGVQDEILTDLAKVADLKVINRKSVMHFTSGTARNLREIGQELGVAHVMEGSVQRSGNRVRVNAQLIDAHSDRHLWGQTYDRDLSDVFAIESEIAKTIAEQLQVKLSPAEKEAIERPPTRDLTAFDLYSGAKNLLLRTGIESSEAILLPAIDLLNQAVARDPSFFDAYCQLAWAHDFFYVLGGDHSSARLALAEAAIQAASRNRPDAGETRLARAWNFYWGYLDYDRALAELELADQTLPNDSRVFELTGYIQRRQGRWEESALNLKRAVDLDPRNVFTLQQIAYSNKYLRRYAEEELALDRVLAIEPNDAATKVERACVDLNWKADAQPLHQLIDLIRATHSVPMLFTDTWLICALSERDAAAAKDALIATGPHETPLNNEAVHFNRPFVEGIIARMTNEDAKAREAFVAARMEQEKIVQAEANYGPALCTLGLIDAALGRKDEALRESRRAIELLPVEKDAINGPLMIEYSAMIAAWVGEKDLACEQLATAIRYPSSLSYGQLKLLPFWDPLRGDPRFEKVVASLAPDSK
jgi:serine/threonine protein kinase/Flp pilus assembly protein TadD